MIYSNLKTQIIEFITAKRTTLNISGAGKCYLGFSSTTPNEDGTNFTEPSTSDYKRIQLNINAAMQYTDKFGTVNNGVAENVEEFTSTECQTEGGWPAFVHFGIFTSETGGTPIAGDFMRDPDGEVGEDGLYPVKALEVANGEVAVFRAGTIRLELK